MNRQNISSYLLVLLALYLPNVHSISIHDLQLPASSSVSWVAKSLRHNGVAIEIQKFGSSLGVEEILEFYRQQWDSMGDGNTPGFLEDTVGDWSIISHSEWNKSLVIQLKPGKHTVTEGFVSSLNPTVRPLGYKSMTDIPLPDDSLVISETQSIELGRPGITTVVTTGAAVASVYRYYQSSMPDNGWTLSTGSDIEESSVLLFSKNDEYCEISMSSTGQGETILMINRVGRPE